MLYRRKKDWKPGRNDEALVNIADEVNVEFASLTTAAAHASALRHTLPSGFECDPADPLIVIGGQILPVTRSQFEAGFAKVTHIDPNVQDAVPGAPVDAS